MAPNLYLKEVFRNRKNVHATPAKEVLCSQSCMGVRPKVDLVHIILQGTLTEGEGLVKLTSLM